MNYAEIENMNLINHPAHYAEGREYEPIKVIKDWKLNFCLGNVVKYISRCGRKENESMLKDLQKAKFYLDFEIENLIKHEKETAK